MDDGGAGAARRAKGVGLLVELKAIDAEVEAGARGLRALVDLGDLPDAPILSAARLRFSRALRRHLLYVNDAVLAYLREATDSDGMRVIGDYRQLLNGYHEAAAHHVAAWPSTTVADDWAGYRRSVADMLSRLARRMEAERRDIHPLLSGTLRRG